MEENLVWPGWDTVKILGQGAFGTVYEVQRRIFDDVEKAAVKVISIPHDMSEIEEMYSDGCDDEAITNTFQGHLKSIVAEYSLMRKMNGSANIVNCDDVRYVQHENSFGWDVFIKMELLTSLPKALPSSISEEKVIKVAKDICAALVLCKKYDIVHRDIKPQNIFLSSNGDYKLGDFGIAKTLEKTMAATVAGTFQYMAPEVYYNQPYGSTADIYSLGLVLYWMLNERRLPFLPLPPVQMVGNMKEYARERRFSGEKITPPVHGSHALKRIVLKACEHDISNRYSSAADMLKDLNDLSSEDETYIDKKLDCNALLNEVLQREECATIEELIQKSLRKSERAESVLRQLHPDSNHIENAVKKYTLPGYVSQDQIRDLFVFDLTYRSYIECRKQQYENEKQQWDKNFLQIEKQAGEVLKKQLQNYKARFFAILYDRILQAEKVEKETKERLQNEYAAHLAKSEMQLQKLYEEGLNLKNQKKQKQKGKIEEYEENHYYLSDKELFTGRKSGFVISKFMPIGLYALTVLVLVWLLILTNMYTPHVTAYFKMPIIVNLVMGWCVPVLARRFANGEKYIFKRRILQVSKIVAKIQIILLFCNIAAVFVGNYYINIVLPGAMIWVTTLDVAMYANCWKPFFVCILSNVLIVIKDIWTYRFINNHE